MVLVIFRQKKLVSFFILRLTFGTHGMINGHGIGQFDFMWKVQSNRQVKQLYAGIWNTQQLLVSFDGCGILRVDGWVGVKTGSVLLFILNLENVSQ
jgi:hypothetical protein